ncbi:MAG: hypothetical protein LLF76_01420 [Planctomycetaceae bacterium]|nr:hypothetical protein [Planctomycetaceae bacterium]
MLPATETRVEVHTDEEINERNQRELEARIYYYAQRLDVIQKRLDELEREWDIERTLEANAATVSLLGLFLGATVNRKWFIFPMVVAGLLLEHALSGWCPPVPIFRRLGIRTTQEINHERYALKALRGDFDAVNSQNPESAEALANRAIRAAACTGV